MVEFLDQGIVQRGMNLEYTHVGKLSMTVKSNGKAQNLKTSVVVPK
jgi:hypothetical protein